MSTKIAINGFGRIGRIFFRQAFGKLEFDIVAINDLGDPENMAYLLKYDSAYGRYDKSVQYKDGKMVVDGRKVVVLQEKDPTKLPWNQMGIDVVIESTGAFNSYEKARVHIDAGAKRVLITAPVKDSPKNETEAMILMGINDEKSEKAVIISNASCTTNAVAPVIAILNEKIGIDKALLNTTHALTNSQLSVDGMAKKDWKEGRASGHNIIPTSTGAAIAVTKAIPDLENKFDGISMRVPMISGSIADITFVTKRETSVEEVNKILRDAAGEERWQGIFAVTEDPIVSSDIVGSLYGSIADLGLTRVVGGNLVKVCAWYDNEWGYTATLIKHIQKISASIK